MKKYLSLFLALIIFFSLSGCGKFTEKDLIGTWKAEITIEELFIFDGGNGKFDLGDDFPKGYFNKIKDSKLEIEIEYYKNGTCDTFISKNNYDKFVKNLIDGCIEYLKDGGLLEMNKELGVKTIEELDAVYKKLGTSVDKVLKDVEAAVKKSLDDSKAAMIADTDTEDEYYTLNSKPEKYSLDEGVITCITDENKKELTYFKLEDNDTIKVERIVHDYEEFDIKCTFKRIK